MLLSAHCDFLFYRAPYKYSYLHTLTGFNTADSLIIRVTMTSLLKLSMFSVAAAMLWGYIVQCWSKRDEFCHACLLFETTKKQTRNIRHRLTSYITLHVMTMLSSLTKWRRNAVDIDMVENNDVTASHVYLQKYIDKGQTFS